MRRFCLRWLMKQAVTKARTMAMNRKHTPPITPANSDCGTYSRKLARIGYISMPASQQRPARWYRTD